MYQQIVDRKPEIKTPNPSLTAVIDLAAWRKQNIEWEAAAKEATRKINVLNNPPDFVSTTTHDQQL